MSGRQKRLVVLSTVLAMLAITLAIFPTFARRRIRVGLESRCGSALAASCTVGDVQITRDGVVATRVRVRTPDARLSAAFHAVGVRFNWLRLATGAQQGVDVRVSGAALAAGTQIADVVRQIRRVSENRSGDGRSTTNRARIDRLVVQSPELRVNFTPTDAVRIADVALEWTRGGGAAASWSRSTLRHDSASVFETERCSIDVAATTWQTSVDCTGFATVVDPDQVGEQVRVLREVAETVLTAWNRGPTHEPASRSTAGTAVPNGTRSLSPLLADGFTLDLRATEGTVAVVAGARRLVTLRPTTIELAVRNSRLHRGRLRLGAGATIGPALEAELVVLGSDDHSWRIDVDGNGLPLDEIARWVPAIPWHGTEHGRTRVRLRVEPVGPSGVVVVDGVIALEDFGLAHRRLSREPIDGLALSLEGAARIDLGRHRVETEAIGVTLNGVSIAVAGWVQQGVGAPLALDASLRLPITGCDAIRRAMPAVVAGPLQDLHLAGTIGADLHLALDVDHLQATILEILVDDRCAVRQDAMPHGVRRFDGPFVQRVQEPQGVRAFVTGPGTAAWVPLARVSPFLTRAVLSREDGRFFNHRGFAVSEIRTAIVRNVAARRFVYGASTISMQLAKNVFLQREKTVVRKLQEVALTWYLERSLGKESILELYLNVVEFGPGIYGVGPAARFFFGREPRDLTPLQSIYLATLLPNPVARFANFQRGGVSAETLARLRAHAHAMAARGLLSLDEAAFAQAESVVFRPSASPPPGVLTQTVPVDTTDAAAADRSVPGWRDREDLDPDDTNSIVDDSADPAGLQPASIRSGDTY